jgi:predicted subunit of tRNA(5-methylaminomethyl-2-thiouridylate) methyltransferase
MFSFVTERRLPTRVVLKGCVERCPMPWYYFNISDGAKCRDNGIPLADEEAARALARRLATEMVTRRCGLAAAIVVTNSTGDIVFETPIQEKTGLQ